MTRILFPMPSPRFVFFALLLVAFHCLGANKAQARVSLDALRRDGYGMVELARPEPNTLTVLATINGRKARLIVDTGWSGEGITLNGDYGKLLRSVEPVRSFGRSASGQTMTGFSIGIADAVVLGNVVLRQAPVFYGPIESLQHSVSRRDVHADGFISAGFLSTCSGLIDLHNLRVYLRPPGTGRRAVIGPALRAQGLAEVPFSVIQTHCLVPVEINGARAIMFVDTGAVLAGVDERFVPQMKVDPYSARATMVDAAGVERQTKLTRLHSFRIGGVNVRAPDLRIGRFGFYDSTGGKVVGLLGMDILGPNGTIIDFGQKKLYFYPL
jgi:predicted aspartyl protease